MSFYPPTEMPRPKDAPQEVLPEKTAIPHPDELIGHMPVTANPDFLGHDIGRIPDPEDFAA